MSERALPCTGVVIVAAGMGTRLGLGIPKAFVLLAGEPMLAHALRGLLRLPGRVALAITVPALVEHAPAEPASSVPASTDPASAQDAQATAQRLVADELAGLKDRLVSTRIVPGGESRHASVAAGLAALPEECDVILVHDAARALATPEFIAGIAGAVRATGVGIVPGVPVIDTIKQVDAQQRVLDTVDRTALRAVQTPQGFPASELRKAYADSSDIATDDAATFSAAGGIVEIVAGEPDAFKITGPADLLRAEQLIAERSGADLRGGMDSSVASELRTGIGTDIHAFDTADQDAPIGTPVRPCWLAGIHFPGERGLTGHSDGDAASHAIVDAVLGAAGLGSIGSAFGTSDPRFAGARGTVFLEATRELLAAHGCAVQNVSVQIVCQRPRFGQRASEASAVLSQALGAPVTVSATTSDGLGFTGHANEGVFAVASALVRVPTLADQQHG
ncbi:MAG: 2-C-methyl-D-erythritol 2,4-cyclodiphosphate synthase [Gulosibacter sp.]|uniref:2-C-methyl-D-erythritol 2,4-cyclodiphosphate synthase n=1 Tax=Gulosibacter sp. TaxID=2817531 RepID=UPI003F92BB42